MSSARAIVEAETPKKFLRQASGPLRDMLELGWTRSAAFGALIRFDSPDFYVRAVSQPNHLVAVFSRTGDAIMVRGSPRLFQKHEVSLRSTSWAEVIPVVRAFWSSLKTTVPEDEAKLPSFVEYQNDWFDFAAQMRARERKTQ